MEDVAGCSLTGKILPKDRAHLHENNPDTIHIHAEWVSWGHFFANLGFVFDSQFLSADNGQVFQEDGDKEISYVLNWEKVKNPFNTLIRSEDRLLISYGDEWLEERMQQYETVSSNAGDYNSKYDPGSCGGTNENGVMILLRDRLHALMWHEGH